MADGLARSPALITADLLRLRKWAVAVLSHQAPAIDVTAIPDKSWRSFLRLERCSAALLDAFGESHSLSDSVMEILRANAATETQSVLRARIDSRKVAGVVRHLGARAIVLKGGVRAITGESPPLPVVDIDLLVHRQDARRLVVALEAAGFGQAARELPHHQGVEAGDETLAVEVHWTTHDDGAPQDPIIWDRALPLAGAPPLERPAPVDYVLHLIDHAVITHSERSVSLRDTLLIGINAARMSEAELSELRERASRLDGDSALPLLDFALAIAQRQLARDPFTESCATFYASVAISSHMPRPLDSGPALSFVTGLELHRTKTSSRLGVLTQWRGSGIESLSTLADRIPGFGPLVVVPARIAYYGAVTAFALPLIRKTKREALSLLSAQTH